MVKLFSTEHTFRHPFERVTTAFWRKYPNDYAAHVKAIDVTERKMSEEGFLVSNRIMSCESAVPGWLASCGLPSHCFVAETSVVDPVTKKMVVKSRNLTGASIMTIEETCTYAAAADNQTTYKQEAKITGFLPFLSGKIESHTFSNLHKKSAEGVRMMETLCEKIQHSGVWSLLGLTTDQESTSS
jgi:hypothetical protein